MDKQALPGTVLKSIFWLIAALLASGFIHTIIDAITWNRNVASGAGLFVFLIVWIYGTKMSYEKHKSQSSDQSASTEDQSDTALETLRQKYAEGEIDEKEFEKRKENLT